MVQPGDLDELGHVNNATYFVFVEKAARAHADHAGLTYHAMRDMGRAFVVRKHVATYYGEARLDDVLELRTWAHSFSGPRCIREVEIFCGGNRIFHSQTDWVWIDVVLRAPKRIPPEVIASF